VYISNENATAVDVYFDDITMTYTPTNVIQYNEYYPFGMQTADSWTRTNSSNNFLYNEGSELNQTSGFYDLPFRNYDASLGRFFQVDPLSHMDNSTSPFAYAGNNPVVFNDPQGLMVSAAGLSDYQLRMMYRRDMAGYLSYDDWASQNIIEYAAGKGFDNMGGSGGGMWGSWSSTPIFGLVQGRKPRYETEGYDYMELGIVGYQWSYTPGNGGSPFDQVMGDPAVSSAGSPIGEWGGSEAQQGIPGMSIEFGRNFSSGNSGVDIKLSYKDPDKRFSDYGWIQTVRTNLLHQSETKRGVRDNEPFNDGKGDGAYPYYGGPTCVNCEGFDAIMSDHPGRPTNSTYVTWMAEVTIGGIRDGVFVPLGTLTYGFDIIDGKLDVYYPRVTEPTPWHVDSFTNKSKW